MAAVEVILGVALQAADLAGYMQPQHASLFNFLFCYLVAWTSNGKLDFESVVKYFEYSSTLAAALSAPHRTA